MLYYLDRKDRKTLRPLRGTRLATLGWSEKDLENLVAEHIGRFVTENQLFIIAQSTAFREEPDIMALDREGRLHIFELKRWQSSQENLLQVLRYGQIFGRHDYGDLNDIFARNHRRRHASEGVQAPELREAHAKYFELASPLESARFNHDQRFIVITNGLDRATREAIAYWGAKKLDVRPLIYRVYETEGKDLLIEIDAYGAEFDDSQDGLAQGGSEGLIVVNTNSAYLPDAWKDMLREGKAAAFYDRKTSIDGITPGSKIALYHTGVGFIAVGKTTSHRVIADLDKGDGEEYHVRCAFEFIVDPEKDPKKAVKAWEVNEALNASHRFRQTVYTLPGEALPFIRKRMAEKGAMAK